MSSADVRTWVDTQQQQPLKMTDSSNSDDQEQQHPVEHNGPPPQEPAAIVNGEDVPLVNGGLDEGVEQVHEEERTLTDHLNKRLLESFLARLDSGSMQLPPGARATDPVEEDCDDFEDQ